jgi:hypothetical protein
VSIAAKTPMPILSRCTERAAPWREQPVYLRSLVHGTPSRTINRVPARGQKRRRKHFGTPPSRWVASHPMRGAIRGQIYAAALVRAVSAAPTLPDTKPKTAPMTIETETAMNALSKLADVKLAKLSFSGVCSRKAKVHA